MRRPWYLRVRYVVEDFFHKPLGMAILIVAFFSIFLSVGGYLANESLNEAADDKPEARPGQFLVYDQPVKSQGQGSNQEAVPPSLMDSFEFENYRYGLPTYELAVEALRQRNAKREDQQAEQAFRFSNDHLLYQIGEKLDQQETTLQNISDQGETGIIELRHVNRAIGDAVDPVVEGINRQEKVLKGLSLTLQQQIDNSNSSTTAPEQVQNPKEVETEPINQNGESRIN